MVAIWRGRGIISALKGQKVLRASNIMKKTQIDTVNIRHGFTLFFYSFLCVLCG
jgi:hypothetical protein